MSIGGFIDYEALSEFSDTQNRPEASTEKASAAQNPESVKRSTPPTPSTLMRVPATSAYTEPTLLGNRSTQKGDVDEAISQRETADMVIGMIAGKIGFHVGSSEWYSREGDIMTLSDEGAVNPAIISALDEIKNKKYTYSQVSAIRGFVRDLLRIPRFEDSRKLLPLKNGVLNLETKQLETYDNHLFNWQLPYEYNPDAQCPITNRYLETATNKDESLISFLMAWMRVLIAGEYTVQKYIELVGDGGTGKSTFLDLCTQLVGENNRTVTDLKSLEGNRFESANLQNKRLTLITDSTRYGGEVSILKAITGGDVIRNEKKNRQAGNGFVYKGLVMVASNEPIQSSDYTSGLARRKIPIVFNARVSEAEKNRYKHGIIFEMKKELPGLLNELLKISLKDAVRLVKYPDGTLAKIKLQNELNTNPILGWMHENLIRCDGGRRSFIGSGSKKTDSIDEIKYSQETKLYPNYIGWCESQGKHHVAINRFSGLIEDNLRSRSITTEKKRGNEGTFFEGLRLRTQSDNEPLLFESVGTTPKSVGKSANSVGAPPESARSVGSVGENQTVDSQEAFIL